MKLTLILLLVTLVTFINANRFSSDDEIFSNFSLKFKIHFRRNVNVNETRSRLAKRFREIEEQNERFKEGNETFTRSLYDFSHFSEAEIAAYKLGAPEPEEDVEIIDEKQEEGRRGRAMLDPPETSFRWSEAIAGKVKNQGNCGSCYAFAGVAAIRGHMSVKYGVSSYDFSEQDAMECTRGCTGGWYYSIFRDYSQKYGGCAAYNYGTTHSYTAQSSYCRATSRARVPNSKVISYAQLANNEKTIRTYLYNYGPLYARFDVYSNFYEYAGGIYSYRSGNSMGGHAILLVGYGEENGTKYWIIKNSWGGWGENGYFRMKRGINLCGIEAGVAVVTNI